MRKVYGLLAVQLSITTLIGGVFLFTPGVKEFVQVTHSTIHLGFLSHDVFYRANLFFFFLHFSFPLDS